MPAISARASAVAFGLLCAAAALFATGCSNEGCLDGAEGCEVASPCQKLAFECDGTEARAERVTAETLEAGRMPGGLQAEGGIGDVLLANGRVEVVIEALDHPHYLAPTGGNLVDLATPGDDNDGLAHVFVATGILPGDAVFYERLEILEEGPDVAAVQAVGHLQGRPEIRVATRYELRPCDPGVRIRTEMSNLSDEPALLPIYDSFWWGGRQTQPFIPTGGVGFDQPPLDLADFDGIANTFPFMAAATQTQASVSHAVTGCNIDSLEGVNSDEISAVGLQRRVVSPRDYRIYERFLAAAPGRAVAAAADHIAEARAKLWEEPYAALSGRTIFEDGSAAGGDRAEISIHIIELANGGEEIPRTQAVPAESGAYSARLAPGRRYRVEARSFGRTVASAVADLDASGTDVLPLYVPEPARVALSAEVDGGPHEVQVFFRPADATTEEAVTGRLNDRFDACAPLLGSPTGPSPACNRVLIPRGQEVALPVPAGGTGRYELYATVGPFATLARDEIDLEPGGEASVHFELETLDVAPEDSLSADFHVHGGHSFDGSLPDLDRVRSLLAASIDAIAATDHDVIHDYADALEALDARDRLAVMPGTETTGFVLFLDVPHETIPKAIGHFNFWPLRYRPDQPSGGSPWSQLAEPGELFERLEPYFTGDPVIQLNHPWGDSLAGRDFGFFRALGVDLTQTIDEDDGSPEALIGRVPPCGPGDYITGCTDVDTSNLAYHVQEVMNGTDNGRFLAYRASWFALLDQGIVRAATANSDSHTLVDNVIGTPRNVVRTETTAADFDADILNASVRGGRMQGTNGPILEIATTDAAGAARSPSTDPFAPAEGAELSIRVRAAPWVPVHEVRVYVNGELARSIREGIAVPDDPFGGADLVRLDTSIPLGELLPEGDTDAYVTVEAGTPLPLAADLNGDGVPETGDNTGDGEVTRDDVPEDRRSSCFRCADRPDHPRCLAGRPGSGPHTCGPLRDPDPPEDARDSRYHFEAVTPGGYPLAFTNPLLFDRNESGSFDGTAEAP